VTRTSHPTHPWTGEQPEAAPTGALSDLDGATTAQIPRRSARLERFGRWLATALAVATICLGIAISVGLIVLVVAFRLLSVDATGGCGGG